MPKEEARFNLANEKNNPFIEQLTEEYSSQNYAIRDACKAVFALESLIK